MGRELVDHNGDAYSCKVDSFDATGSVIRLNNARTGDEWVCCVTYANIDSFWTLSQGSRLYGMPCAAVGIMRDVLHASRGTGPSPYCGSASLVYKHSPFYMEVRVKCTIREVAVEWTFPMVPKAAGEIEHRIAAEALDKKLGGKNKAHDKE
ncbi:hypothetical protein PHYPSEUDO_012934 [Phytophthora pseudosyringae]|uniref:Uncharacterized protein n=1 Tax=Phytophthora pseudosyringae TaxID=221518 RepID=A0A8T1V6U0_9STRA|nr:hypothetical protein PHYPSEUDO_012934 [Phytophthora pseudosyringae]